MVDLSPTILIIMVSTNELHIPIKRQKLSDWIQKQDSIICCLQRINIYKYVDNLKVKGWKKIPHKNMNKKTSLAILILIKADF